MSNYPLTAEELEEAADLARLLRDMSLDARSVLRNIAESIEKAGIAQLDEFDARIEDAVQRVELLASKAK